MIRPGGADHGTSRIVRLGARIGLALLLWAAPTRSVMADVRIISSPGGEIGTFLDLFQVLRASGERVVIDGPCLSACTLVLSAVPKSRICVTPRAVLGFHAARSIDEHGHIEAEPAASQVILTTYPLAVRRWIVSHGGLSSHLLLLRGRTLATMYPRCR